MEHDTLIYEKLDLIEERIQRLSDDAAFLLLYELPEKGREVRLERLNFTRAELEPFLERGWSRADTMPSREPAAGTRLTFEGDELDGEGGSLEIALDQGTDESPTRGPTLVQRLKAVCGWLRDCTARFMETRFKVRFRLRIFGVKGYTELLGASFRVINPFNREVPEVMPAQAIVPAPREVSLSTGEGARPDPLAPYYALGQYYDQFGQILLNATTRLGELNADVISGLNQQNRELRESNEGLVTRVLTERVQRFEVLEQREARTQERTMRNQVIEQAMGQLGQLVQVVLVSKGITPEVRELGTLVSSNPELGALLADPAVRQLLADRDAVRSLQGVLRQLAQQHVSRAQQPTAMVVPGLPGPGVQQPDQIQQKYDQYGRPVSNQGQSWPGASMGNPPSAGPAAPIWPGAVPSSPQVPPASAGSPGQSPVPPPPRPPEMQARFGHETPQTAAGTGSREASGSTPGRRRRIRYPSQTQAGRTTGGSNGSESE